MARVCANHDGTSASGWGVPSVPKKGHEMKVAGMKFSIGPWSLTVALLLGGAALPPSALAQLPWGSNPESIKQTDRLIGKAEDLVKQVVSTREEIDKTLGSYNSLFAKEGAVKDVRSTYKDIDKNIERCEKQREEVKKRLDAMKVESDAYFASWNGSLQEIKSEDLRKRSEERMNETRRRFDGILSAAGQAREQYEPFIASLRDQWTYLGHDLNPSGIASLKPDADKLNQRGAELFKTIDGGMKTANEYIASLRSTKPTSD